VLPAESACVAVSRKVAGLHVFWTRSHAELRIESWYPDKRWTPASRVTGARDRRDLAMAEAVEVTHCFCGTRVVVRSNVRRPRPFVGGRVHAREAGAYACEWPGGVIDTHHHHEAVELVLERDVQVRAVAGTVVVHVEQSM